MLARRILAASAQGHYQTGQLRPFSLQLIHRTYEAGGWDPRHELARVVEEACAARRIPPLATIPADTMPGFDWCRPNIVAARLLATLPVWMLERLEIEFPWVIGLVHAENPLVVTHELIAGYLVPEGRDYFAAGDGTNRGEFLPHLYAAAPRGPIDIRAAHPVLRQLERGVAPAWFAPQPIGVFRDQYEAAFVRATFDPTPDSEEPITFEERLALLLVYRAQLDVPQLSALLGPRVAWTSTSETTAEHLRACFVQVFRSMLRG